MKIKTALIYLLIFHLSGYSAQTTVQIDLDKITGSYKNLLGINKSPLFYMRNSTNKVDLTELYKLLSIKEIRVHDNGLDPCHIYTDDKAIEINTMTDVTATCTYSGKTRLPHIVWSVNDINEIDNEENYDFSRADESISYAQKTGADIYLRLGESFRGPNDTDNYEAFARVANNIYKHYIGKFKPSGITPDISAIEVFNEPDGMFWVGDNDTLHSLVKETIKLVRNSSISDIPVGAAGFVHQINKNLQDPSSVAYDFIEKVGEDNLDFFSAHFYGECDQTKITDFISWIEELRENIDKRNMQNKPIHITEWNIGTGTKCSKINNDIYNLPMTFAFASSFLFLAQEDRLNVTNTHFYAGWGGGMSIVTPLKGNKEANINSVFWTFHLHKQFIDSKKVETLICENQNCLTPYENAKNGNTLFSQAYKNGDGYKLLFLNNSNEEKSVSINLKGEFPKEAKVISYEPKGGTKIPFEKQSENIYTLSQNALNKMIEESIKKRDFNISANFSITLKPYTAKIVEFKKEKLIEDFIKNLYIVILDRSENEITEDEISFWKNRLDTNESALDVIRFFTNSKEFQNLDQNITEFITKTYKIFLDRSPDKDGEEYWTHMMNKKGATTEVIIYNFAFSKEFASICEKYGITAYKQEDLIKAFIERLYSFVLNRKSDPKGMDYWFEKLRSHEKTAKELVYNFFYSKEFLEKDISNFDFISIAYMAIMGREGDKNGIDFWLDKLNNDQITRKDLIDQFLSSKEFQGICEEYGITQ